MATTEGLLLQTECDIDEEIQRLMDEDAFTVDEWRFIDGSLHSLSGNALTCLIYEPVWRRGL